MINEADFDPFYIVELGNAQSHLSELQIRQHALMKAEQVVREIQTLSVDSRSNS